VDKHHRTRAAFKPVEPGHDGDERHQVSLSQKAKKAAR